MRVAAIQMVSSNIPDENLASAGRLLSRLRPDMPDLIVFPENFLSFASRLPLSDSKIHEMIATISAWAQQEGCWIVAGTLPMTPAQLSQNAPEVQAPKVAEEESDKAFAVSLVFDANGERVGGYCKMHLFDAEVGDATKAYRESNDYLAGHQPVVIETPWATLGLSVCYDLRFPEYFRALRDLGAEVICCPSAFTRVTGQAHWEVLCRARAIETQCYMVAANQGGVHRIVRSDKSVTVRETWGQSLVVNPWGEVVSKYDLGEGVVLANVNFDLLQSIRAKMPIQSHRRID